MRLSVVYAKKHSGSKIFKVLMLLLMVAFLLIAAAMLVASHNEISLKQDTKMIPNIPNPELKAL